MAISLQNAKSIQLTLAPFKCSQCYLPFSKTHRIPAWPMESHLLQGFFFSSLPAISFYTLDGASSPASPSLLADAALLTGWIKRSKEAEGETPTSPQVNKVLAIAWGTPWYRGGVWALTAPSRVLLPPPHFGHWFVILQSNKCVVTANPKPCCSSYQPAPWPWGTTLSSRQHIKITLFFSPIKRQR